MKYFYIFLFFHFSFLIFNCFSQQPGWEIIPSGTSTELNSIFFYDYEVGFACGNSGTIIKSIDSGKTWQSIQTPVTNDLNDLYMFHQDTMLVIGDLGAILFTTDGGSTWMSDSGNISENLYSIHFSNGNGLSGGSSQSIYWIVYTGSSLTWIEIQSGFFGGGFWGAYMLSPQIGFVAGENSIFQPLFGKSTNSGVNWDFTAFYLNSNEGRATGVDFTDLNTGYVSASVWDGTGAIAKTTNGGSNWISTMFTNPLWSIDFPISGASQVGYAVGSQGTILKTYNAGMNWLPQQSGTILRLNKVHFKDFDFGFAVGENGLILRTTTGGEPVTLVKNENQSPYSFELFQNYPNPFNPSTVISYQLPVSGNVTLKVYDVLGNEIATLVNGEKPAGEYEVEFSAKGGSASGGNASLGSSFQVVRNLASGIYFYQLRYGEFIQTKKMIYLK